MTPKTVAAAGNLMASAISDATRGAGHMSRGYAFGA